MSKEMFNLESMNRKLGYVLQSSKSRLKKKNTSSNNCTSLGKTQSTIPKKISVEKTIDIDNFRKPRSIKKDPKTKCREPSQTDRQSKSICVSERVHVLTQELESIRQRNGLLESMITKLRTEKAQAQAEQTRLSEQIISLTQSQSTMAHLNGSANERLTTMQRHHEDEIRRVAQKERNYTDQIDLLKREAQLQKQKGEDLLKTSKQQNQELTKSLQKIEAEYEALKKQNTHILEERSRISREKDTTDKSMQLLSQHTEMCKKKCSHLENKNQQLKEELSNVKEKLRCIQSKFREQTECKEKEQQRNSEKIKTLEKQKANIEEQIKEKFLKQIDNIQMNHKEAIKKVEDTCSRKIKEMQQLFAGKLEVKQKEIDLLKISTASQIEKANVQLTQIALHKNERDASIKNLQKKISELTGELKKQASKEGHLEEQNIQQRLKMEEMEAHMSKLNRMLFEAKQTADKSKTDKSSINSALRGKDEIIEKLETEKQQLQSECGQLVEKLEDFCNKVQTLESHMQAQQAVKRTLQTRLNELQLKISYGLKDCQAEQQIKTLTTENEQLRRSTKEHKVRLKISEDRLREMQGLLDEANENIGNHKHQIQKISVQSHRARLLSQEVESSNRISQINLKSLLKNLQDKEQLAMTLKDQLVKEQFRNDLLITQLKTLKQNHRAACTSEKCSKNNTPAFDEILREKLGSSRKTDSAFRTIDTNATSHQGADYRLQKMTI